MIDKEILNALREESNVLLVELKGIVEKLDSEEFNEFPANVLADFSQRIDRIMGAAKTIGMEDPTHPGLLWIGKLAEVSKALGYKAQGQKNLKFLPIFAAFWADTIDGIEELMGLLEDAEASQKAADEFLPTLQKRLQWLLGKVATPGASGGPPPTGGTAATQDEIDALLNSFGKS